RRTELNELRGCDERYQAGLREKLERLKTSGGVDAAAIADLEARIGMLNAQLAEIREAAAAGGQAYGIAEQVLSSLDSAEGWSTWDMLGGGLISDMAKYGHLEDAQRMIEQLQVQLRRFKTELADVKIQANMSVQVEGFLQFADFFFDGLFADWAVRDSIHDSQHQVRQTWEQIGNTLDRLEAMEATAQKERDDFQTRLDTLVVES
ncbi:MAG: hypothetical protein IJZ66_09540, partial [Oscillibacter sp.]|nr:hypothetical protein [Oscillibacter sp.]